MLFSRLSLAEKVSNLSGTLNLDLGFRSFALNLSLFLSLHGLFLDLLAIVFPIGKLAFILPLTLSDMPGALIILARWLYNGVFNPQITNRGQLFGRVDLDATVVAAHWPQFPSVVRTLDGNSAVEVAID